MVKRYGFTPKTPVSIELYADTSTSACAPAASPNVGIQGVCFGQTLAACRPQAAPFNWGNVLWHELGHVFAIQISKNHVPRWYTEGLSEYETIIRRPEWQREEDPALYAALKGGRIPSSTASTAPSRTSTASRTSRWPTTPRARSSSSWPRSTASQGRLDDAPLGRRASARPRS
jgi:hypothetical protein